MNKPSGWCDLTPVPVETPK